MVAVSKPASTLAPSARAHACAPRGILTTTEFDMVATAWCWGLSYLVGCGVTGALSALDKGSRWTLAPKGLGNKAGRQAGQTGDDDDVSA